jgi:hypothetical protein
MIFSTQIKSQHHPALIVPKIQTKWPHGSHLLPKFGTERILIKYIKNPFVENCCKPINTKLI